MPKSSVQIGSVEERKTEMFGSARILSKPSSKIKKRHRYRLRTEPPDTLCTKVYPEFKSMDRTTGHCQGTAHPFSELIL